MRRTLAAVLVALVLPLVPVSRAGAGDGGLAAARERANRAARELADAETRLGQLEADINALEARLAATRARLTKLRASVIDAAIDRFVRNDEVHLVDADISRQAKAEALARLVTSDNQDSMDEFTAAIEDLDIASKALAEKKQAQRAAVASLAERRDDLFAELRKLEALERERQRREAARRDAARRAAAQSAAAVSSAPSGPIASGSWICPVQGPVAFTDTWGAPRSGGRRHQGVDMLAARGTPTVAPVGGRVEHRGNSIGGLSWHLYGDDGHYYYGTHLSAYANVGAGHVAGGTVIGYVGDTGNARGTPHLHFEIHPYGGAAVNPYPTVARYC